MNLTIQQGVQRVARILHNYGYERTPHQTCEFVLWLLNDTIDSTFMEVVSRHCDDSTTLLSLFTDYEEQK